MYNVVDTNYTLFLDLDSLNSPYPNQIIYNNIVGTMNIINTKSLYTVNITLDGSTSPFIASNSVIFKQNTVFKSIVISRKQ